MEAFASGAAFVDRSGAVVAADEGFVTLVGLSPDDPTGALRRRAEVAPDLRAFLAGDGGAAIALAGAGGARVDLERVSGAGGALLVARPARLGEWLEHAMRSVVLGRVAGGVAHDIKNPLNAMTLQLALLGEKLPGAADASATAAGHLSALRDQVGKVNEVLRRFLDVADPSAPLGFTDVGALLADVASLLGHEGRRRQIEIAIDAAPGAVRTSCEPARVGRLVLGLFARALAETPDGGKVGARAETRGPLATIAIEHVAAAGDPELGPHAEVVAAGARVLGGSLVEERRNGLTRWTLSLPGNGSA
jgi:signal transduction histidine kinase